MALPIIGAIGAVLLSLAGSFVLRVLTALGLSAATYCGFSGALDYFENLVSASLSGLPAEMLSLPGYMKAGKALTIVFSVLLASMVVKELTDGACKRFVRKTAEVGTIALPKEVFGWYQCASLHTVKRRMPGQVRIFLFCLAAVPLLLHFVFAHFKSMGEKAGIGQDGAVPVNARGTNKSRPMSTQEYNASFQPRVPGFAHTAP